MTGITSSPLLKSLWLAVSILSLTVAAIGKPGTSSSDGFEPIALLSTSTDKRFDNKAITCMNDDLRIIQMGNMGLSYASEFGWNEETSELAEKRYILDGKQISSSLLYYEWITLTFATEYKAGADPKAVPTWGLGAPLFTGTNNRFRGAIPSLNDRITGPYIKANLIANAEGRIGMKSADGSFVSKWYACDTTGNWGSGISWLFGDEAPSYCVPLEITKFKSTKSASGISSAATPIYTGAYNDGYGYGAQTTIGQLVRPSYVGGPYAAMQTASKARRVHMDIPFRVSIAFALAILFL